MILLVCRLNKNQSKMKMINLLRKKSNLQRPKIKKKIRNHTVQKTKNPQKKYKKFFLVRKIP